MALVGNIRDFSLSDFLSLVDRGYKTGALHLSHNDQMARLYFEKGKLLLAARRPEDEKPELLVRLGVLNADQVAQACRLLAERGNGLTLSQILIDTGLVSADRLQQALMSHTEQSVYGLFAWPEGDFLFEHNQRPAPDAPLAPTPISIDHLIMEGYDGSMNGNAFAIAFHRPTWCLVFWRLQGKSSRVCALPLMSGRSLPGLMVVIPWLKLLKRLG